MGILEDGTLTIKISFSARRGLFSTFFFYFFLYMYTLLLICNQGAMHEGLSLVNIFSTLCRFFVIYSKVITIVPIHQTVLKGVHSKRKVNKFFPFRR